MGPLLGSKPGGRALHGCFVIGERAGDQLAPGVGEVHNARAPVRWIVAPLDHALALQAVDRSGHGSAREAHHPADLVHRQWTLMKQDFQGGEIGKADA